MSTRATSRTRGSWPARCTRRDRLWQMELYRRAGVRAAGRGPRRSGAADRPADAHAAHPRRGRRRVAAARPAGPGRPAALCRGRERRNRRPGRPAAAARSSSFSGFTPAPWTPEDSLAIGRLLAYRLAENHGRRAGPPRPGPRGGRGRGRPPRRAAIPTAGRPCSATSPAAAGARRGAGRHAAPPRPPRRRRRAALGAAPAGRACPTPWPGSTRPRRAATATPGSCRAGGPPPAARSWPTTRTCSSSCPRSGTRCTWWPRASTCRASRCPARRSSPSATTPASPGASPTPAPTCRTSSSSASTRPAAACRPAGGWEAVEVEDAPIPVRGRAEPAPFQIWRTPLGRRLRRREPRVGDAAGMAVPDAPRQGEQRALVLKWSGFESGGFADAFEAVDRAGNWAEFQAALDRLSALSQNAVYADVDGNIGYLMTGQFPQRVRGDGTRPGSAAEVEWAGDARRARPCRGRLNPERGYLATSNNPVVRGDAPFITRDWVAPYRAARVTSVLGRGRRRSTWPAPPACSRTASDGRRRGAGRRRQRPGRRGQGSAPTPAVIGDARAAQGAGTGEVGPGEDVTLYQLFEDRLWHRAFTDDFADDLFYRFYQWAGAERAVGPLRYPRTIRQPLVGRHRHRRPPRIARRHLPAGGRRRRPGPGRDAIRVVAAGIACTPPGSRIRWARAAACWRGSSIAARCRWPATAPR